MQAQVQPQRFRERLAQLALRQRGDQRPRPAVGRGNDGNGNEQRNPVLRLLHALDDFRGFRGQRAFKTRILVHLITNAAATALLTYSLFLPEWVVSKFPAKQGICQGRYPLAQLTSRGVTCRSFFLFSTCKVKAACACFKWSPTSLTPYHVC